MQNYYLAQVFEVPPFVSLYEKDCILFYIFNIVLSRSKLWSDLVMLSHEIV